MMVHRGLGDENVATEAVSVELVCFQHVVGVEFHAHGNPRGRGSPDCYKGRLFRFA
jgi:hypothetical protein